MSDEPAPNPTGHPQMLTRERQAEIVRILEEGNSRCAAAKASGVSYTTFKIWMNRGRTGLPKDAAHRKFRRAVIQASAKAEVNAVAVIKKLIDLNEFKAAAFFLERTKPRRWGKKTEKTLNVNTGGRGPIVNDAARRFLFSGPRELVELGMDIALRRDAITANPHHPGRFATKEQAMELAEMEWRYQVGRAEWERTQPPIGEHRDSGMRRSLPGPIDVTEA